jgi:hypothetical protein
MGSKPKVRSPAKKTKRANKKGAKEKPQRERFIEAARAIGVDETGKEFERLFAKVVPPKAPR